MTELAEPLLPAFAGARWRNNWQVMTLREKNTQPAGSIMAEERITETETPSGNVHTTHTVVTDDRPRGGGAGWLIALVLIVVAVGGFYLFSQQSNSEIARDNAIAEAAGQVGDAAQNVGEAAKDAVKGN